MFDPQITNTSHVVNRVGITPDDNKLIVPIDIMIKIIIL